MAGSINYNRSHHVPISIC